MTNLFDDIFAGQDGVANFLLTEFGTTCTIEYTTGVTFDPVAMTNSGGTPVIESGISCSPPCKYKKNEIDGTYILTGDTWTCVPEYQLTAEPPVGAIFTHKSKTFKIVHVYPIESGEEIPAYKFRLRSN